MADGLNRAAVEAALEGVDADPTLLQVVRSLADAVDEKPHVAALWDQYRSALADLRAVLTEAANPKADLIRRLHAVP